MLRCLDCCGFFSRRYHNAENIVWPYRERVQINIAVTLINEAREARKIYRNNGSPPPFIIVEKPRSQPIVIDYNYNAGRNFKDGERLEDKNQLFIPIYGGK